MYPSRRPVLVTACAAALLVLINYTVPLGMLGAIGADLHADLSARAWVLSGGALGVAGGLLSAGSLADTLGRKRIFVASSAVFALVSVIGALSESSLMLIIVRIVQGLASAGLLACSLAILATAFPEPSTRMRATGAWGAMVGAGIAVGPVMGALLTSATSWRMSYWVLAALSALLTVAAGRVLVESRVPAARSVDWAGMFTLAAGLGALVAALLRGNPDGWGTPHVLLLLAAGVALFMVFTIVEHRRREPMLELRLLRSPGFTAAFLGSLALGGSMVAFMNYFPTWSQQVARSSVIGVALQLLLWSVPSAIVAFRAHLVARYLNVRLQLGFGMLTWLAGTLLLLGISPDRLWTHLIPGFLIAGIGTGVLNAALARAAVDTVPSDSAGLGAGANNTARYIGNALGVAALTALAAGNSITPAIVAAALLTVLGAIVTFTLFEPSKPRAASAISGGPDARRDALTPMRLPAAK
jgi:MFS family permease